jgi:hypothetical protein
MAKRATKDEAKVTAAAQLPAAPRPLTDAERAELVAFGERLNQQPRAPRFKMDGKERVAIADGVDNDLGAARLAAAVGSADQYTMTQLANQAIDTLGGDDVAIRSNTALALLTEIQPRNGTEGMLAAQMVGCHNLAMAMLRRATKTDRVDFLATYGSLATKLMRTFALQTEALARLRGQTTQQTVRVEHVTVESGAQAVVGAVATGTAADGSKR